MAKRVLKWTPPIPFFHYNQSFSWRNWHAAVYFPCVIGPATSLAFEQIARRLSQQVILAFLKSTFFFFFFAKRYNFSTYQTATALSSVKKKKERSSSGLWLPWKHINCNCLRNVIAPLSHVHSEKKNGPSCILPMFHSVAFNSTTPIFFLRFLHCRSLNSWGWKPWKIMHCCSAIRSASDLWANVFHTRKASV